MFLIPNLEIEPNAKKEGNNQVFGKKLQQGEEESAPHSPEIGRKDHTIKFITIVIDPHPPKHTSFRPRASKWTSTFKQSDSSGMKIH
jgi:hypothetical protein